jgi:hypothetical protein
LSQPIRAKWAGGRREQPTTSLLLFFFGLVVLLIFGVIGAQGGIGGAKGVPALWAVMGVVWALGAVLLALITRRDAGRLLEAIAFLWWVPFLILVIASGHLGLFG